MASKLVEKVLDYLDEHDETNSLDLVGVIDDDHQKIIGAIKSLQTLPDIILVEQATRKIWEPTEEGQHVIENGSHEAALYNAVPNEGIIQSEIMKDLPYGKVGLSKALQAGWVKLSKKDGSPFLTRNTPNIVDTTQIHLRNLGDVPENIKAEYKKRKMLREVIIKSSIVRKGPNFCTRIEKQEADLTADLLTSGAWREKKFKPYNFDALGSALEVGHLHPLLKVRTEFRKIFLEMGFMEMPTNNFVESSFWNFDALFQPQQHPARDAHDTFFVSEPRTSNNFPKDYMEKVKEVHSNGGYGSQGYRYDWKIEEAQKNLLRTHTTAVSARMLYRLMQQGEFKPVRYFSIDRVFRNETLDATHLAEFHQVEGVIADYNLTLGDLIGTLYEFFKKLGIEQLEFKPAYNPYTEPSMEIFCFHNGLGKWIEIGNSGIFRPEMLLPMGLPENVNVIAWGLSLERPTMIKYGINNIRDLVGPKVDLQMVYNNPVCRLEKTGPRVSLARKVQKTPNGTIASMEKQEIVIFCDPNYPMYSLESLLRLGRDSFKSSVTVYTHCSVTKRNHDLTNFCHEFTSSSPDLRIDLIWKSMGLDPLAKLPGRREIYGVVNIARYLNRLIEARSPGTLIYETRGASYANKIDSVLDNIHATLHGYGVKWHKHTKHIRAAIRGIFNKATIRKNDDGHIDDDSEFNVPYLIDKARRRISCIQIERKKIAPVAIRVANCAFYNPLLPKFLIPYNNISNNKKS